MNKVILIGRLTKEPDVKIVGQQNLAHCNFTLAVDRRFKNSNGEREADFISCVAWRTNADVLGKYFHKGSKVGIVGTLQTRSYEKDGNKVFVTEVLVEEIHFVESKQTETTEAPKAPIVEEKTVAPVMPDELPFDF